MPPVHGNQAPLRCPSLCAPHVCQPTFSYNDLMFIAGDEAWRRLKYVWNLRTGLICVCSSKHQDRSVSYCMSLARSTFLHSRMKPIAQEHGLHRVLLALGVRAPQTWQAGWVSLVLADGQQGVFSTVLTAAQLWPVGAMGDDFMGLPMNLFPNALFSWWSYISLVDDNT